MDFRVPELGEGVYEAELVAWLVKPGDLVKRGQPLMEVLTDKATMEVPSPFAGTISSLNAEPGRQLKVGDKVLTYTAIGKPDDVAATTVSSSTAKPAGAPTGDGRRTVAIKARPNGARAIATGVAVKAAPSVRYLARKLGIDLAQVNGTGPHGRVLIDDISTALKLAATPTKGTRFAFDLGKPGSRIKVQGVRRKIAEHMVHSKRAIPHYSYVDECDATRLVQLRSELRKHLEASGVRLTYSALFVRAVVRALIDVPLVNAELDEAGNEIILHDRYHIGIAVAAPAGLIVPVVRDADRLDLVQTAREVERLSAEARAGKSRLDDLRGSTFTVTSIGSIGGMISTPVINHPNVGIMGVGKIVKRPVYDEMGNIRPADIVYLSFSFDHRVVDGAIGALFGNAVRQYLEHPAALLLKA